MTKTLIFDRMGECTDDEVRRLMSAVSVQRAEQARRFRFTFGQYACLKSYTMLAELTGLSDMTFGYGEFGKPFLTDHPELHFSISHCRRAIAVAVSDLPVGIDVESLRPVDDALMIKTMNQDERHMIDAGGNRSAGFARLWTRKEAVLKLRGTGIVDNLYGVLSGNERIETYECSDYVWSLAIPCEQAMIDNGPTKW